MSLFKLSKKILTERLVFPSLIVFLLGWIITGILINSFQVFQITESRNPASNYQVKIAVETPWIQTTANFWHSTAKNLFEMPSLCWFNSTQSQYLEDRCQELLKSSFLAFLISAFPFIFIFSFILFTVTQVSKFYRSMNRVVRLSPKTLKGEFLKEEGSRTKTLTEWIFEWVYCLKEVKFRIADGRQVRAYVPQKKPYEQEKHTIFALFDGGIWFKKRRWIAVPWKEH